MSDPTAGPTQPAPGGPPPGYAGPPPGQPAGPPPGQPQHPQHPQHLQAGQPIAPPPGWNPAMGQPGQPGPTAAAGGTKLGAPALLSIVSIAAMALAVTIEEDSDNGWGRIGVWAGFAIFAAVLTLAPAIREQVNLTVEKAWQVGVAGAAGLAAFWVLFVLPSISMNVSFAATVGVVAGLLAAWMAPGRPAPSGNGSGW